MSDKIKGGVFFPVNNGKKLIFHMSLQFPAGAPVNRGLSSKARCLQKFFYPKPVKFHPGIFPGILFICNISIHLIGADKKALVRLQVVNVGLSPIVRTVEDASAFDNVVK